MSSFVWNNSNHFNGLWYCLTGRHVHICLEPNPDFVHDQTYTQKTKCSTFNLFLDTNGQKVAYHLLPLNTSPSGRFLILMSAEGRDSLFILPAIGTIILHRLVALWLQSIIRHWERLISTPPIFPCHHLWVIKLGSPARLTKRLPMDKKGKKRKWVSRGTSSLPELEPVPRHILTYTYTTINCP